MFRYVSQIIAVALLVATFSVSSPAKDKEMYGDLKEAEALEMFDLMTEALLTSKALENLNENYKKASQSLITKIQTANAKYNDQQAELRKKYGKKDYCTLRPDMTWDCNKKDNNATDGK